MNFLITLVAVTVFCFAFRTPIKKAPWVFYLLAAVLVALSLFSSELGLPHRMLIILTLLIRRAMLATAFFTVVMVIGVFPRKGKVSHWLRPIRAELSIIACILICGHLFVYIMPYLQRFATALGANTMTAILATQVIVTVVLLLLVALLGVTSLRVLKRHMHARTWKQIQSLAYLFYVLVVVHLLLMIGPSALNGGKTAIVSAIVYLSITVIYVITRIVRARVDRREKVDLASTVMDQGFRKM